VLFGFGMNLSQSVMFRELLVLIEWRWGVRELGVLFEYVLGKQATPPRVNVIYKWSLHILLGS
jgi:hypothetical protein